VFGRRDVLFISEQDLAAHNLAHGDVVEVASPIPGHEHKRIRLTAIAQDIASGSIGAYCPEANNLCPLTYQDPESGTPSYKSLPVRLRKVA
jgi:anaerobic selenocysteine-containing dehydrogenase